MKTSRCMRLPIVEKTLLWALILAGCTLIVDNKLKEKPASSTHCASNDQCTNNDPCDGNETCNTASERCEPGVPLQDGAVCTSPTVVSGKCVRYTCIPTDCGNGTVDSDREDCDTALDPKCPTDCIFECQSAIKPKQGCAPPLQCSANACIQPQVTNCPQPSPNKCTRVIIEDGKCVYKPWNLVNNTAVDADSVTRWLQDDQYAQACDASCTTYNATPGNNTHVAFQSVGYCQPTGDVESPKCYSSFDYNCNGILDSAPSGEHTCQPNVAEGCQTGWSADSRCGKSGTVFYCGNVEASKVTSCENPVRIYSGGCSYPLCYKVIESPSRKLCR